MSTAALQDVFGWPAWCSMFRCQWLRWVHILIARLPWSHTTMTAAHSSMRDVKLLR